MNKPDIIIFDFDETLIDVFQEKKWFGVLRERIISYYSEFLDIAPYLEDKYMVLNYNPYYELIEKIDEIYPEEDANKINKKAFDIVESFEKEVLDTIDFFDGVGTIIPALYNQGFRLGIVSNNGVEPIKYALSNAGLDKYFDAVAGRVFPYHLKDEKPGPNYMYSAIKQLNINESDIVWYVGDRITDIQAARNVGFVPIAVATGKISAEDLQANGAEKVFANLSQLYKYLQ